MDAQVLPEFEFSSERDILATVLHAAEKFSVDIDGHGDSPNVQPLSPALKRINKLEDLDAIHSCPLNSLLDDEEERYKDGVALKAAVDESIEEMLENANIVRELMDCIMTSVSQFALENTVVSEEFMQDMVNEITNVAIPRCQGVHDLHSSSVLPEAGELHILPYEPKPKPARNEHVTAIIDYLTIDVPQTKKNFDAEMCGDFRLNSLCTDRREQVGAAKDNSLGRKCMTLRNTVRSTRIGAWARIKRAFLSVTGQSKK